MTIKTIHQQAADYRKSHATGNSYYDEKIEQAYLQGAIAAIDDISGYLAKHLTPYYTNKLQNFVDTLTTK